MFAPQPLPRNLEASFRDLGSDKAATRVSAIRDVVRHALRSDDTRGRAIPKLERALKEDTSPSVRSEAAVALADIGASEALPILLFAVEDDDPHVRQMALSALGEIGDARASHRLERALRDPRPEVRYQAVIAFARVAKDDSLAVASALARALDDDDGAIRYIAMRVAEERLAASPSEAPVRPSGPLAACPSGATGRSSDPMAAPVSEASESCSRDAAPGEADVEMMCSPPILTRAEQLVDDPDDALAVVTALYLARLGRPRGRDIVLDVVAERRTTPEIEDEQACVELAGELPLREAIPHLERRAWGTRRVLRSLLSWGAGDGASCAWHARIALARMGHERARLEILADLTSWRRETREAAVVATGRARIREAREPLENLGASVDEALVREALVRLAVD
jgi:HEAT repeat protein